MTSLLESAKSGDRKAVKSLYEAHKVSMFKLCRLYVKDVQVAEDLLQEGFIKTFSSLHQFNVEKGSFITWMRKIFTNECLMYIRKQKRSLQIVEINDMMQQFDFSFEKDYMSNLSLDEIYTVIHKLPEGYRTVFTLYVIEGFTHAEIAEILAISVNTSKTQLSKAKKKLQETIISKFPKYFSGYAALAQ